MSGNSWNWTRICDRSSESCHSWQTIKFTPARPVVFIRIVGTHNTANEVFHCVHFECPSKYDPDSDGKSPTKKNKKLTTIALPPPPETATEAVNIDQEDNQSTVDSTGSVELRET